MGSGDRSVEELNPASCPAVESLDVIGEQWRLNVLQDLQEDEKRFDELKRSTGASSRTLSGALDVLVEHGLVEKRREVASPIAVYYSLTEKGEALEPVFHELADRADEWMDGTWYEE